jgi:hypothetical protein
LNQTRNVIVYLIFSFIAAAFLGILVITTPSDTSAITISEKRIIGGVFLICCIFGISFTIRPNWVRRYFPQKKNKEKNIINEGKRSFRGHHPDCHTFQNHIFQRKQKTWCAGCLGLFIGLCVSILLMILYIVINLTQLKIISYLFFILGLFILPFIYLEIIQRSKHPLVHILSNSMLPLSFFFITISVIGLTGKLVYGLFTILLCFLWLDTRIQLSQWRHRLLCMYCTESCKMYDMTV